MMDMMEMFIKNFPKLMTPDCSLAFMKYAASLVHRIYLLMKKQPEFVSVSEKLSSNSEVCYLIIKG